MLVLIPCLRASQCSKLALGLLLSYCSRFCNLIALLWAPKSEGHTSNVFASIASPEVMWSFIIILFFISSVRVYQGKFYFHVHEKMLFIFTKLIYIFSYPWSQTHHKHFSSLVGSSWFLWSFVKFGLFHRRSKYNFICSE